jgi:hypothetical protein
MEYFLLVDGFTRRQDAPRFREAFARLDPMDPPFKEIMVINLPGTFFCRVGGLRTLPRAVELHRIQA